MKYLLVTTALLAMIGAAGAEDLPTGLPPGALASKVPLAEQNIPLVPNVYTFMETPWGPQPVEVACLSVDDETTPPVNLSGLVVSKSDGDYLKLDKPLRMRHNNSDCKDYSEVLIAHDPEVNEGWNDRNVLIYGKLHTATSGSEISLEAMTINSTATIPEEFLGKWCNVEAREPTWSDGQMNRFRPCKKGDTPKYSFLIKPTKVTIADKDFCIVTGGYQRDNGYLVGGRCASIPGTRNGRGGFEFSLSRRGTDLRITDQED